MQNRLLLEPSSASLHIIAMVFMLCDHLWGTIISGSDWLTCIGRISFPIFAFLLVEGYFHTKNLKRYALRLFLFALISEIPFNLAMGSSIFYPVHQNILWSLLISLCLIHWNEKAKQRNKLWQRIAVCCITVLLGFILGLVTMVDFYHAGILTVLIFYFFRKRTWWGYLGQLLGLWYINIELLGGFCYEIHLWGEIYFLHRQGFALLALIPIWLYQGRQGHHSKAFQYACYLFYPLHLLILGILKFL